MEVSIYDGDQYTDNGVEQIILCPSDPGKYGVEYSPMQWCLTLFLTAHKQHERDSQSRLP